MLSLLLAACGGGGTPAPTTPSPVSSIAASASLSYGQTATLVVSGTGLDAGINLNAPGCASLTLLAGASATQRSYSCQVTAATQLAVSAARLDGSGAFVVNLPVPDPQVTMVTSMGSIVLELDPAKAPISVTNFLKYTRDGFYAATLFHRVISTFVIQGGGFSSGLNAKTATYAPIALEASNGLANVRGSLAMARTSAPDSATSQFYINVVDNPGLNNSYAVFGKVVSGLDVVDAIKAVPTGTVSAGGSVFTDVPVTNVLITSASQTR